MSFISLIADNSMATMMSDSQGTDPNMVAVNHGLKKVHRINGRLVGIVGDYTEASAIVDRLKRGLTYDDIIVDCVVLIAEYVNHTLRVTRQSANVTLIKFGVVYESLVPFDCRLNVTDMLKTTTQSINERKRVQKTVNDLVADNSHSVDTYTQFEVIRNE